MKPILRELVFAGALLGTLASMPRAAHASERHTAACAAFAGDRKAPQVPLAGGLVLVRRGGEELAWDARFIVDVDAASDFRGGAIAFAVPLPPGETLRATPGITTILENDQIVGLCVAPEAIRDRTIAATFIQPLPSPPNLGAPIATGRFVQIVDAAPSADTRLEVTAHGFERNVGFVAPRAIGHDAREEARRLTDTRAHLTATPVFVRGDDVLAEGGLAGRVLDARAQTRSSALGVGLVFAGIVAALLLAAQRLRHRASIERADAVLALDIERASGGDGAAR